MPPRTYEVEVGGQTYLVDEQDMPSFINQANKTTAPQGAGSFLYPLAGLSIPSSESTPPFPEEAFKAALPNPAGLAAVALGSSPIGSWAYRMLPQDAEEAVRTAAQQSWEEQPYYSGAAALGTGIASGAALKKYVMAPLAEAAMPILSKGAQIALKYPTIAGILGAGAAGAEQGIEPALESAGTAGALGAIQKGALGLGSFAKGRLSVPSVEVPEEIQNTIAWMQKQGMGPEEIQSALKSWGETYKNLPPSLQSELPLAFGTKGRLSAQGVNLATQKVPGTEYLHVGQKTQRFDLSQPSIGNVPQPTMLQKATQEVLGQDIPSWQKAQQEGMATIEESRKRAQQSINKEDIYAGMMQEPKATVPLTKKELAKQELDVASAKRARAKEKKLYGRPITLLPEAKTTKVVTEADPILKNLATGKDYRGLYGDMAARLKIPEGKETTQQSAKMIKSGLDDLISGKRFKGTDLEGAQFTAKKLRGKIVERLNELNPDLPEADIKYARAKTKALMLTRPQQNKQKKLLESLRGQESSADLGAALYKQPLGAGGLDYETYRDLMRQVGRQMGEEGVLKVRDAVSASIIRDIQETKGEKVLSAILPKGINSKRKLRLLFGAKAVDRMEKQLETVKALRQAEIQAIADSKTGVVGPAEKSLKIGDGEELRGAVNNLKFSATGTRFLKRTLADAITKVIKVKALDEFDKKELADFLFTRGMDGAKKLNRVKKLLFELKKTEAGRELVKKSFDDWETKYLTGVARSFGVMAGPAIGGMNTRSQMEE